MLYNITILNLFYFPKLLPQPAEGYLIGFVG